MGYIAFAMFGEAVVFLALQQAFKTRKVPRWLMKGLLLPDPHPDSIEPESLERQTSHEILTKGFNGQASLLKTPELTPSVTESPANGQLGRDGGPSRNIIHQTLTRNRRFGPNDLSPLERKKWQMVAERINSTVALTYLVLVLSTPIVIFYIIRLLEGSDKLAVHDLSNFRS